MTNPPNHQSEVSLNPLVEELLEILWVEEDCYPWNPSDLETEAYFTDIEQKFSLLDDLDEEIASGAETFFNHLQQRWTSAEMSRVKNSLFQQFGNLVPTTWLETIIEQAERMMTDNVSQINRLIGCVKPLWSNWTEEDLQVFARPLAYAMRGTPSVKEAPWQELSEMERIRLSLSIAKEALTQLQEETN